jgi:hypothetical protein
LGDLDPAVVMVDGIHFRDRVILVALGIYAQGNKHVLGLREGSTESTRVVRSLLSDLVDRGLDADRARLWVIDGCKALRKAIVECFGATALVQRCQEHKRRNVLDHLPEELHASRAARPSRHADIGRRVEQARRRRPTRRTQGRVGSPMRSRHPASFNTEAWVELKKRRRRSTAGRLWLFGTAARLRHRWRTCTTRLGLTSTSSNRISDPRRSTASGGRDAGRLH